jgi:hypothetical protein
MNKPHLDVAFVDAPNDFADANSPLRAVLEAASGRPTRRYSGPVSKADLILYSTQMSSLQRFGDLARMGLARSLRSAKLKAQARRLRTAPKTGRRRGKTPAIWITGENIRPPLGEWTATLSFDVDDFAGCNLYFPIWWTMAGAVGASKSHFTSADLRLPTLLSGRRNDVSARPKFACAFVGNPDPMRMHAIKALSSYGAIDVYGAAVGRPVRDKHEIAKHYRFMICFENDIYPGYVTEKPFEAWASGCIPIWWGSDPLGYVNQSALINFEQINGLSSLLRVVSELDAHPDQLNRLSSMPILLRPPQIDQTILALRRLLPKELLASRQ